MNKQELIEAVAAEANLPKSVAARAVQAVLDNVTQTLRQGGEVRLTGFGAFSVKHREGRAGRNPQTGEAVTIAAAKVPSFKAGADLKTAVNRG